MLRKFILLIYKYLKELTATGFNLCPHWSRLIFVPIFFISIEIHAELKPYEELSIKAGFYLNSFPYISRTDAEVGLKYWGEQVGKSQNIKVSIDFYDNVKQMRNDFDAGKINFIVAAPIVILNNFERTSFVDGFTLSRNGSSLENLIVITRKNEGVDEFKNLSGKKIGLLSGDDIAQEYMDFLSLKYFSRHYQKLFSNVLWVKKKPELVYNLFFKKVDAVIIYEASYLIATELNPQIKENTQVINSLNGISTGIGVFHKSVPVDFREQVISYWVNLGNAPGDQYLLQMFQSDKFERLRLDELQSIDNFLAEYQSLLNNYKK